MTESIAFKSRLGFKLFISLSFLIHSAVGESGYLKFCSDEHKQVVQSTSCSKGLWLNVPMKPGCICVKGVWALSDGFCDKNTAIVVGEDHCFHAGFNVRAVKYIGNHNDPFAPSTYTAPLNMDIVNEIPVGGGFTPRLQSESSIVIGINPRRTLERGDKTCLQLDDKNKGKPVHIYVNPLRSSNKWRYGTKGRCHSPKDYTHHLGFGEMFQGSKVLTKDFIGRDCQAECPATNYVHVDNKARAFSRAHPGRRVWISGGRTISLDANRTRIHIPKKSSAEIAQETLEERAKVHIDIDDYHREVNEQTLRMMHAQISPLLLKTQNNQINTREYEYFQKARIVVQNLCPEEYVPDKLVEGLMRMFKQLLWESMDQRNHNERSDNLQFKRILNILDNCTTPTDMGFKFLNYTGSYNFTGADKTWPDWPQPEQCPEPLVFGVNGTDVDGQAKVLQNVTGFFHPHLKFNASLVDFVIETAWKIVMIAHYQCSKSFNGTTAADFSTFFHQVELFFNDKIVKRWYDPINVENINKVVQLIFPSYDLKKFAFGLDICMFSAQQFSDFSYNSKWIQRPKIPFTANEMSQDKFLIPGASETDFISTDDYAPKISRRKRDSTMWDGKAYCMDDFLDPVNIFGYSPKKGCRLEKS